MAGFRDIVGHENIISHMKQAAAAGKVSHAYMLDGPADSGKSMLAKAFAMALLCERQGSEPCLACRSCRQVQNGNQPDLIWVQHEKPKLISTGDVREQINKTVDIRPYASRYKIYIVEDAQKMNVQAQNALLKTLEEPPAYVVLLLLTTNSEQLLQTIRSRCVLLRLQAVADEKIRAYLMQKEQLPDYQANLCLGFAQGNVGKAIRLARSEHFSVRREQMLRHVGQVRDAAPQEIAAWVAELADWKEEITEYMELLLMWFRDVLLQKAGAGDRRLIFSDKTGELSLQAEYYSWQNLYNIISQIRLAQSRIRSNVNRDLTLEVMFHEMEKK